MSTFTNVESGTCWPVEGDFTNSLSSVRRSFCISGRTSSTIWIRVHLGEVLAHLALAEGVVKRVVDQLRLDAVARRLVPVDGGKHGGGGAVLLVADHVAQLQQARPSAVTILPAQSFSSVGVGVLDGVLVLEYGLPRPPMVTSWLAWR